MYIKSAVTKSSSPFRLIGPPSDWALSQLFIKGNKTIYGKIYKNNMAGLESFYPIKDRIEFVANNESKLAFIEADPVHSYKQSHCKVCYYPSCTLQAIIQKKAKKIIRHIFKIRSNQYGKQKCPSSRKECMLKETLLYHHFSLTSSES